MIITIQENKKSNQLVTLFLHFKISDYTEVEVVANAVPNT